MKRQQITHKQAHARILAGLPTIIEETRNNHGHPIFTYWVLL